MAEEKIKVIFLGMEGDLPLALSEGLNGYETLAAENLETAAKLMGGRCPDLLVLCDNPLGMTAVELAKQLKKKAAAKGCLPPPFIVISAKWDKRLGLQLVRLGALDWVTADASMAPRLAAAVRRALKENALKRSLLESETKLKYVFQESNVAESLTFIDGQVIPNQAFCELLGYSREELSGLPWQKITVPEDIGLSNAAIAPLLSGKLDKTRFEKRYLRKDGSQVWCDVSTAVHRGPSGEVEYFITVMQDITRLRESERQFQDFFDKAPLGYQALDREGRLLAVNEVWTDLLGYGGAEVKGRPFADFLEPSSRESFQERYLNLPKCGRMQLEERVSRKDGRKITLSLEIRAVCDSRGRFEKAHCILKDVTSIRSEEEKLRRSEERFRGLFENHSAVKILVDPADGGIVDANEAAAKFYGWSREQLKRKKISDINVLMAGEIAKKIDEVLSFKNVHFEFRHRLADGSIKDVEVFSSKVDWGGRTLLHSIIHDISDKKSAEAERRLLSEVVKASLNEIYIFDADTLRFKFLGEVALRNTGYTQREASELTPLNIEPDFTAADYSKLIHSLRTGGSAETGFETRHLRKDGTFYPVDVHLQYSAGQKVFLAVVIDISERKKAEVGMARLQAAIEQAGEAIIVTSPEGVIEYVNPAFERSTGYLKTEVVGRKPSLLKSGAQDESFYGRLWRDITGGRTWTGRLVNKRKDGTLYTEEASISPVVDASGRTVNFVAVKRDVTERERMQTELLTSQKIESLGVLAGGIAHDFNNMLTGIMANLSLLVSRKAPGSELAEEALLAAENAKALTAQLLNFSKGGKPVKKENSPEKLLKDSLSLSTRGSSVRTVLDLEKDLWSLDCDEMQLKQAINNILLNGLQAMPDGGQLTLRAENLRSDTGPVAGLGGGFYLTVKISDTGGGIPRENLERIFEPYFSTKSQGHGLGLTMAWNVVRAHGGSIKVSSVLGKGTEFTIFLPATGRPCTSPKAAEPGVGKGTGRILLLEDDPTVAKVAARILAELGYESEVCAEGRQAVSVFERAKASGRPFRAAILDLTIPGGMGGIEACCELRKISPDAIVVASSGYSEEPVMADYSTRGFDAILPKPYTYEELGKTLAKLLSSGGDPGK